MKRINKETFIESLRQYLNNEINVTEASAMCGVSVQMWSYRAKIMVERGDLPEEYWTITALTEAEKREKEFFDSIRDDIEEPEEVAEKKEKRDVWHLKNFKHM